MAWMVTDRSMGRMGTPSSPRQPGFSVAMRRALYTHFVKLRFRRTLAEAALDLIRRPAVCSQNCLNQ